MELGFEPRKGSNFTVLATVVVREIVWKRALQYSQTEQGSAGGGMEQVGEGLGQGQGGGLVLRGLGF